MKKKRKAVLMLLFQPHIKPGVKGWELKRALGRNYMKVLEVLSEDLDKLGLKIKVVHDEEESEKIDRARFFIVPKNPVEHLELTGGWKIDDLAMLAASVAYIISKHGKAPRKEVEQILLTKFPKWKVDLNIDKFIRRGYLACNKGVLYLDWRAKAEIDQKSLLRLIIEAG